MLRSVVGSVLIGLGFIGVAMGRGSGKLSQEFPGIWIGCIVCLVIGFIIIATKPKENTQVKAKRKKKKDLKLNEHLDEQ